MDIAAELFVMAATNSRALALVKENPSHTGPLEAADLFSRQSRRRVEALFTQVFENDDVATYRLAQQVLEGEHLWLEGRRPRGRPGAGTAGPAAGRRDRSRR